VNTKDPKAIALKFNDCITHRDIDGLASLMAENHTFIDRNGKTYGPKNSMIESWKKFFAMFPHYKNTFTRIESSGNRVAILGYAYWSEEKPHDSAIWIATIADDLVSEWRIYQDTEEIRKAFDLAERSEHI
jgi:ketosteroid isomerase-like protein